MLNRNYWMARIAKILKKENSNGEYSKFNYHFLIKSDNPTVEISLTGIQISSSEW